MKNQRGWGGVAASVVLALACVSGTVEARPSRDVISRAGDVERYRLTTVAVLPAVSVTGDALAESRAEAGWVAQYGMGSTRWMRADEVSARIAADGELARAVREQIWRTGAVDGELAARLCRELQVDAVVSLRVDRWELAERRGMVAMTSAVHGADGSRLWTASGMAGYGRRQLPDTDAHASPDYRTCVAYSVLLARWAGQLPGPMRGADAPTDALAFSLAR
jgi:hypothetical protein